MAGTAQVIAGKFNVKFGAQTVHATEYTSNLAKETRTAVTASDGASYVTVQPRSPTAEMTILMTSVTDEQALLDFNGTVSVYNTGTGQLEKLYGATLADGISKNKKDGTGSLSLIAMDGEVL